MADHHGGLAEPVDEVLEPVQSVGVQVVGRLVEQVRVVPRQQQCRQAQSSTLAAGQVPRRLVQVAEVEVDRRPPRSGRPDPRLPARATTPARARTRRRHRRHHRRTHGTPASRRVCAADTPVRRSRYAVRRLVRQQVDLLGEVADGRMRRESGSPRPQPGGRPRRESSSGSTSRPRWDRPGRPRHRGRPPGRARRTAPGRRSRPPLPWPATSRPPAHPARRPSCRFPPADAGEGRMTSCPTTPRRADRPPKAG